LKELDDVLGGADAWKNVPSTEGWPVLLCFITNAGFFCHTAGIVNDNVTFN